MKLFLDARMLGYSGVGRYLQNIIEKFDTTNISLSVFINPENRQYFNRESGITVVKPFSPGKIYSLKEQFMLHYYINQTQPDIVHFPNFNVAIFCSKPFVVTIHDLIYLNCPDACPNYFAKLYAQVMIKYACRDARIIITDSQYSKTEIIATLKIPETKIRVISPGVDGKYRPVKDPDEFLSKYTLPDKFILYTGNHEKRKNIVSIIKAYALSSASKQYSLVIGGRIDKRRDYIYKEIQNQNIANKVIFTDYVPEEVLPALYTKARLFVFPSAYEGFGLPVLEAMACGTPVICSNLTSLPEVSRDAAYIVDPYDTHAFAKVIDTMIEDETLRAEYRNKGFERAKHFSWDKTVKKHLDVYHEVLDGL